MQKTQGFEQESYKPAIGVYNDRVLRVLESFVMAGNYMRRIVHQAEVKTTGHSARYRNKFQD